MNEPDPAAGASGDRDTRPPTGEDHRRHLLRAVELAREGSSRGDGGPFGAVVVLDGRVVGEGWNQVVATADPTAHAEIVAVRRACAELGSSQLVGAHVYASCEPCPMCLGALYWARPAQIHHAATREHAAEVGFDDSYIYDELALPPDRRRLPARQHDLPEAVQVMRRWAENPDRTTY
ncbi:nucleoside deaminase [uncultured Ornithinimicrobium sp.]|uniref:nucleoside deaminase n=1 Tax=uncultured Ornithinimicrobium sp. TaxID=259307 RepID=UPI002591C79A|nr:nucleoside deaminase [uncultured Ornithinimicrobium sp.]